MEVSVTRQRRRARLFSFVRELNLFESGSKDTRVIHHERLSTRLYVVLMCAFVVSVVIYAALLSRTIIVTISRPSEYKYKQLFDRFPETLLCPCSRISIKYQEFTRSQVVFHEVCQSQFISQEWIDAVYAANVSFIEPNDIRTTISAFWQFVRFFCDISKNILIDVYTDFNATLLLTSTVQSEVLIETQIGTSLNFSLSSVVSSLKHHLLTVRGSTIGNGLLSGLATNYYFYLVNDWPDLGDTFITIDAISFADGCSCSSSAGCSRAAIMFSSNESSNWMIIPGMMFDCLALDATLASSLQCFYETWCSSRIQGIASMNTTLESLGMSSRFPHNITLQVLIDELMIEQLSATVSFSLYYTLCDPVYCTYSYSHKFDALFIVTLVLSACGGVSTITKLLAPVLIKLVFAIHAWKLRNSSVGVGDVQQCTRQHRSLKIPFRSLIGRMRSLLLNLNLFKSSSRNAESLHRQQITTRVFIICLLISLTITSLYAFLSTQTRIIEVPRPSRIDYERLLKLHSDSIQCSCSQLAISHSDLIKISPTFHQLCSSPIILPEWYNLLIQSNESLLLDIYQFQVAFGANYFQVLAMFCDLAQNTVADAYRVFSARTFITNRLLSEALFSKQIKVLTDAFIVSTSSEFIRTFSLTRKAMQISQLASQTFSNFQIFFDDDGQVMISENKLKYLLPLSIKPVGICSCLSEANKCGIFTYVYNSSNADNLMYIKTLIMKCLPTESVLFSTLECWYNQTCSSLILTAYTTDKVSTINDALPLDDGIRSRFPRNTTMETMMNELLLENWTITVSYDQFFNKCAPVSCVYTVEQRFDLFFVLVTIFGIYSGLSESLRLLLPIIVRLVLIFLQHIRIRDRSIDQSTSTDECTEDPAVATSRMIRLRKHISTCNLFKTSSSTTQTLPREILSTRLYLLLLIVATTALFLYTGLIERTKTEAISNPSQLSYEYLQKTYSNTLQCPCSNVSISYSIFTRALDATYHPVCSSDFVSDRWFTYFDFYNSLNAWWLQLQDFRKRGSLFFQLLQSFCSLANSTIGNATEQFLISSFITSEVMPPDQFELQINEVLALFQKSISTLFTRPLQVFRASNQGNALLSILGTNWYPMLGEEVGNVHLRSIPITYNNGTCSCATSSSCIEPAAFYNLSLAKIYIVEDVFTGCSYLESILLSSLSCFFSNSCISEFIDAMSRGIPGDYWKIDNPDISSIPLLSPDSRYKANDTIETIVNQLFVDTWSNETSFERYFNACAPSYCKYSYTERLDVLYILTTFLSVFNGLSIGLYFTVRLIVTIAYKIQTYFQT